MVVRLFWGLGQAPTRISLRCIRATHEATLQAALLLPHSPARKPIPARSAALLSLPVAIRMLVFRPRRGEVFFDVGIADFGQRGR